MKCIDTQGHTPHENHSSTRKQNSWTTRVGVGIHAYTKNGLTYSGRCLFLETHRHTYTHMYIDTRMCIRIYISIRSDRGWRSRRGLLPTHKTMGCTVWDSAVKHAHTYIERYVYTHICKVAEGGDRAEGRFLHTNNGFT